MQRKLLACFLTATGLLCSQSRRVDPKNTYDRLICVTPMVGSGTAQDPRRPEYAPWPTTSNSSGIVAFTFVPGDDGKSAIVEFTAYNMGAFKAILADKTITVFQKGKDSKATIEAALQKYKKGFSMDAYGMVL